MKTRNSSIATLLALVVVLAAQAHESKHKLEYPGFRPPTEQATAFAQNVASSKIAVFPSIVRTVKPKEGKVVQGHSKAAEEYIVAYLGENKLGNAEMAYIEFEIGEAPQRGQFALFNHSIETIAGQLDGYQGNADYILVLDLIRVRTRAWGIQCYILDRTGENVFSFLLNSHHKPFVDAAIQMKDDTAESEETLIMECTELALKSLHQQVHMERDIAVYKPAPSIVGKYIGEEDPASNYIILNLDGTCEIVDDGQHGKGTYAVVGGNTLILIKDGQRLPVGWFEDGTLITSDGRTATKTDDSQKKNETANGGAK